MPRAREGAGSRAAGAVAQAPPGARAWAGRAAQRSRAGSRLRRCRGARFRRWPPLSGPFQRRPKMATFGVFQTCCHVPNCAEQRLVRLFGRPATGRSRTGFGRGGHTAARCAPLPPAPTRRPAAASRARQSARRRLAGRREPLGAAGARGRGMAENGRFWVVSETGDAARRLGLLVLPRNKEPERVAEAGLPETVGDCWVMLR